MLIKYDDDAPRIRCRSSDFRVLNCADFGDPTTRQRFFFIGRTDGEPLRWPEPTHAKGGSADLLGARGGEVPASALTGG